jgi:GntR family transcriptional regulator, trigonelline degradation regulator
MASNSIEREQLDHTGTLPAEDDSASSPEDYPEESSSSRLAKDIKDAIVAGEYKSGERLKESVLATKYQTTRAVVREALKILEVETFIQPHPTQGYIVYNETLADAYDIYEMREVVEGLAARLFTERALRDQIDQLEIAIREFGKAAEHPENKDELLLAKNHVYDVLLEGCGNKILYSYLQSLRDRISNLRRQTLSQKGRPPQTLEELQQMFDAIKSGKGDEAEQKARNHVREAAKVAYSELRRRRTK